MEQYALPRTWDDAIESRVRVESMRLGKELRDVIRSEILKVINGKQEGISPTSILNTIGLSARQADAVDRARVRLLAEGKLKGKALEKDLDKLRAKLLAERAALIAEHETRMAHAIGQQAAWERLFAEGKLKGGRRHWHKLWVVHETEHTCGECMDLDGQEVPLDALFESEEGVEYGGPPEPHPRCRCSLVLVEVERNEGEDPDEALGRWVTLPDGRHVLIGDDDPEPGSGSREPRPADEFWQAIDDAGISPSSRSKAQKAWEEMVNADPNLVTHADTWKGDSTYPPAQQAVERLIEGAPNYSGTVYRGTGLKELQVGDEYEFKRNAPSSRNPAVATRFVSKGGTFFRIKIRTGADITKVGDPDARAEAEVVIRRGSRYRVTKVARYALPDDVLHVVDMEEVL
jgi:hypothetical protein